MIAASSPSGPAPRIIPPREERIQRMFTAIQRFATTRLGRILATTLLAALVLVGATACVGGAGGRGPATTVSGVTEVGVYDNYFDAASISVPVGTTVTWTWQGQNSHNVVGDDFESPVQNEGEFAYTFDKPGTYPYECTLHGGMTGEVIVTAAS
jgi:plastocyanin